MLIKICTASTILEVSDSRVRQFIERGDLKATKVRNLLFLEEEEVRSFASQRLRTAGRPPSKI